MQLTNGNSVSKKPIASALLSSEEGRYLIKIESQRGSDPWQNADQDNSHSEKPYLSPAASVTDSFLHSECAVEARVDQSVICSGVTVGRDSDILESVIMPGATIGRNVTIHRAIIGEGAFIDDGACVIGSYDRMAVVYPSEAISN